MIFTDNTTICCVFLNTVDSLLMQTTFSLATMWTEGSRVSRRYAYSWHTRLNTLKTSSSCAEITNALRLTVFTAFTRNASGGTTSNCGKRSSTVSTVFPFVPSSTKRSFACMAVWVPILRTSIRSNAYPHSLPSNLKFPFSFLFPFSFFSFPFPSLPCSYLYADCPTDRCTWFWVAVWSALVRSG